MPYSLKVCLAKSIISWSYKSVADNSSFLASLLMVNRGSKWIPKILILSVVLTSINNLVDHAQVLIDQGNISYLHLLVDKTSGVSCDEDRTSHEGRDIGWESLMGNSVSFIVMDSAIPNNGSFSLEETVQDFLFVADCSWNGTVWDII